MNNFFSMSAITTGLSSGDIQRLHLTWAHVNRSKSTLESLQRYMDPTGGFSNMRALINSAEGPGVPFVVMLFTDLLHVAELKDSMLFRPFSSTSTGSASVSSSSLPSTSPISNSSSPHHHQEVMINFQKRQRWYDIIVFMLKFQSRPYEFSEKKDTRLFIHNMFKQAAMYDKEWAYTRSKEVVHSEMAHADIRRGLEEAGF
jgi:son of sevenless-like protein